MSIPPAKTPGRPGRSRTAFAGRRFLVIDDHPYMTEVVGEMLRHFGGECVTAESVEAAIPQCRADQPFDCIVCDFNMKPVNGLELLQVIRLGRQPRVARDQPFLLLTGHGELDVVKTAKLLDVSAYVVKPVAVDTFVKAIDRALGAKAALQPPARYEAVAVGNLKRLQ